MDKRLCNDWNQRRTYFMLEEHGLVAGREMEFADPVKFIKTCWVM